MLLEFLGVSEEISSTTKHTSTRSGLSSIEHKSMCDDERISMTRCISYRDFVDTMCVKELLTPMLSTRQLKWVHILLGVKIINNKIMH